MVDLGQKGYAKRTFFFDKKEGCLLLKTKKKILLIFKNAFHRIFVLFNNFFVQA